MPNNTFDITLIHTHTLNQAYNSTSLDSNTPKTLVTNSASTAHHTLLHQLTLSGIPKTIPRTTPGVCRWWKWLTPACSIVLHCVITDEGTSWANFRDTKYCWVLVFAGIITCNAHLSMMILLIIKIMVLVVFHCVGGFICVWQFWYFCYEVRSYTSKFQINRQSKH